MQRPELIPARLLAALVTPEFHRGEGFSRLFLDSPWPSGRLLTLPATIPAIPQVLHLPVSPGIHLRVAVMQVGGYRPQFRPHRGVIGTPGRYPHLFPAAFVVLAVSLIPAQDIHGSLRS